jgi:hypothetical protein
MTDELFPNFHIADTLCQECGFNEEHAHKNGKCMTLAERMKKADWWHDYSDSYEARVCGRAEVSAIQDDLRKLHIVAPAEAKRLWRELAPKEWSPPW